jgi:uncharacterized membrane protein YhaH (DUF805 family)
MCRRVTFPSRLSRMMLLLTSWAMGDIMSTRHYLFHFCGRVSRAKIWLWFLIAIVATIVALVIACFGFDWSATLTALKAHHGQTVVDWSKVPKPGSKGAISLVALILIALIYIAYLWSKLAVYAKRLHDRGRSAWWLIVYLALPLALFGYAGHVAGTPCFAAGAALPHHGPLPAVIAHWLAVLICLWVFIDLYCLKGTKGANKYGADPLEPNWCDPEKPVKGCVPKPE